MIEGTIMKSRDATFFESEFPIKNTLSTSSLESILPEMHEPVIQADVEVNVINPEKDNNIVTPNPLVMTILYTLWMTLLKP
jgi:hypothetical protein